MRPSLLPQRPVPYAPDRVDVERDAVVEAMRGELAGKVLLRARLITGDVDPNAPTGLTEGVAFTGGVAREVDHGLGEECVAWLELPIAGLTARPNLSPSHLATTDRTKKIRLTAATAGATRCWLLVFPRSAVDPR